MPRDRCPWMKPTPSRSGDRSRSLTATNQSLVPDQLNDISTRPSVADVQVVPSSAAVSNRLPNAPVQARWAHAQRAGPSTPNPPTVACNRLLGGMPHPHQYHVGETVFVGCSIAALCRQEV